MFSHRWYFRQMDSTRGRDISRCSHGNGRTIRSHNRGIQGNKHGWKRPILLRGSPQSKLDSIQCHSSPDAFHGAQGICNVPSTVARLSSPFWWQTSHENLQRYCVFSTDHVGAVSEQKRWTGSRYRGNDVGNNEANNRISGPGFTDPAVHSSCSYERLREAKKWSKVFEQTKRAVTTWDYQLTKANQPKWSLWLYKFELGE